MGPKMIAVTLMLLVGAVAAYDVKFLGGRKGKQVKGAVAAEQVKDTAGDAAEQQAAETQAKAPQPPDAATPSPPASKPQQPAAVAPAANALPPLFDAQWTNPFTKTSEMPSGRGEAADAGDGQAATTSAAAPDASSGYEPVVSAVLIGGNAKHVVINRQVLTEGDRVPGIGATVKAITDSGVELQFGSKTRFFRLSVGSTSTSEPNQQ